MLWSVRCYLWLLFCVIYVWFAVVVLVCYVCFICELVVICCSVSLAECNISHILGLKVCCRERKRNYSVQKWECNDEVYVSDGVSVHRRCWLKVRKESSVDCYRYISARPNSHLAGSELEIGKRSNSNWTISAFFDIQTWNTKTLVVDKVDFFFFVFTVNLLELLKIKSITATAMPVSYAWCINDLLQRALGNVRKL